MIAQRARASLGCGGESVAANSSHALTIVAMLRSMKSASRTGPPLCSRHSASIAVARSRFCSHLPMDSSPRCLRILVVDDDHDAAQSLAELLPLISPVPMAVTVAFDGQQAVDLACHPSAPPDMVLLDMEMPGLNGFDAAAAIQARLRERTPRLIAVSGNVKYVAIASSTALFHHALGKPVDVEHLVRLLDSACPQG